jgi:hypothetical protein
MKKEREALHALTPGRLNGEGAGGTTCYTPEETKRKRSGRRYILYPRGDVKKKEREALHAIKPMRRKEVGAGNSTCDTPRGNVRRRVGAPHYIPTRRRKEE